jgi:hypothetical protein
MTRAPKDLEDWLESWMGSMQCGCDHGCNQWLKENSSKAMIVMRVLAKRGSTDLDALVRRPIREVDAVAVRLGWRYHSISARDVQKADEHGCMYAWKTGGLRWTHSKWGRK